METEFGEKMLQLENNNIALTTKCEALQKEVSMVHSYNDQLAKSLDELCQDKRNCNLFMTGLKQHQTDKMGFLAFSQEVLGIEPKPNDIKAIFKVNTTGDPIMKIIFQDLETRLKFSNQLRKLAVDKNLWFREDLTKPCEHLAWLSRKAAKGTPFHSWTSMGTVLISKGPGFKPKRINTPHDLISEGLIPGGVNYHPSQDCIIIPDV